MVCFLHIKWQKWQFSYPSYRYAFYPTFASPVLEKCKSSLQVRLQVHYQKSTILGTKKGSPKAPQIPINYPLKAYKIIMSFQHARNTLKNGVLSPYSSSGDTLLTRLPEISVDCLITARFVITVPFPLSPACSR